MGLGSWLTKKMLDGVKSLTGLDIPNVEPQPQPKKPKKETQHYGKEKGK